MDNTNLIQDVTDTAYWVAYYRAKESERSNALFNDPLAKSLVGEHGKNISDSMAKMGRYTEWSVISRTVIIDRFILKLIREGVDTVINLGAGLDTRPYRMDLPKTLEWVEADHPKIIAHKTRILAAETPRCRLTRVAIDLANNAQTHIFLKQVAPQSQKTLILTEGVIPYLSPDQVTHLAQDLLTQTRFRFWIAEYFHPRVYRYLKASVRGAAMKNAPFRFYPDDWYGFFKKTGWTASETRYLGEIALEFKRKPPMPRLAELLLPFLPKKIGEEALRMTGYIVFERG